MQSALVGKQVAQASGGYPFRRAAEQKMMSQPATFCLEEVKPVLRLPFFFRASKKGNQKRYLPATPTLGAWFHQASPALPPLMLYDPPESWRLPHDKALF